jgi:phosphoribosylanthranilate isomerase
MVKVKICGLRLHQDIEYVNVLKPDYVGFVFAESKRRVTFEKAKSLSLMLHDDIIPVGVFVNEKIEHILNLVTDRVIKMVQLHGDEDEAYIRLLKEKVSVPIIKAVRVKDTQSIVNAQKLPVEYLLLDTYTEGIMGGSGKTFDHSLIPALNKPYFLAGGLTPDNITEILSKQSPFAVDVSGGVETNGYKDMGKISEFIQTVKQF